MKAHITMKSIDIGGKEFEIFASTAAVAETTDICGNIGNLTDFIRPTLDDGESLDLGQAIENMATIIKIFVNAAADRRNFAIKEGLESGEPSKPISLEYIKAALTLKEMTDISNDIIAILGESFGYEIPDGVDISEEKVDETLEEIKDARAKN